MGEEHTVREITDPLESEPERLHAELPVAFAIKEAAETGDEPDEGIERRRLLRRPLLGQDVDRPPFLGREQQRSVEVRQVRPSRIIWAMRQATIMNRTNALLDARAGYEPQDLDSIALIQNQEKHSIAGVRRVDPPDYTDASEAV